MKPISEMVKHYNARMAVRNRRVMNKVEWSEYAERIRESKFAKWIDEHIVVCVLTILLGVLIADVTLLILGCIL